MRRQPATENRANTPYAKQALPVLLILLVFLAATACTRQTAIPRHCVPLEEIQSLLESDACTTLMEELAACRDHDPQRIDFRSLHRLQDAATYCYVKNAECDKAAEVTPRTEKTRFHLSWVAACYQATGRYEQAASFAGASLDFWSQNYAQPRAIAPFTTCLVGGDSDDTPGSDEQALQMALCTYLNSSLQLGRADEIPSRMQGPIRDPNWQLLLYDYYLNRKLLDAARPLLAEYLEQGGCLGDPAKTSIYTRRTRQRACNPAMRYMAAIGLCKESASIYEQLKPVRPDAAEAPTLLMLANCFLVEGDTENATAYADEVRKRSGDTYDLYLLNGHIALYAQNIPDALFYFELASDIARRNAEARSFDPRLRTELAGSLRMQAQALAIAGRDDEAAALADESWEIAQAVLAADPANNHWLLSAANSAHFRHDLETQAEILLAVDGLAPSYGAGDLVEAAALTGRHSAVRQWGEAALLANHHRPAVRLVLLTYIAISHGLCGDIQEGLRLADEVRRLAPQLSRGCSGWYAKAALAWAKANPGPHPETLVHLLRSLDHCTEGASAVDVADALDAFLSACSGEPEGTPIDCR